MQADYVIVGAGSAGCAMAYRLSEAGHSVLVIEHGGTDAGPDDDVIGLHQEPRLDGGLGLGASP
ncbi:MAG: FAD-dependent oxidoreductase, partial [Alphaproteobacteria bacterium]